LQSCHQLTPCADHCDQRAETYGDKEEDHLNHTPAPAKPITQEANQQLP